MTDEPQPPAGPLLDGCLTAQAPPRRRTPNPDRPRLTDVMERRLAPTEEKTATAYTAIEDNMARIDELLGSGAVQAELDPNDTAVHRIAHISKPAPGDE